MMEICTERISRAKPVTFPSQHAQSIAVSELFGFSGCDSQNHHHSNKI